MRTKHMLCLAAALVGGLMLAPLQAQPPGGRPGRPPGGEFPGGPGGERGPGGPGGPADPADAIREP